LDKQRLPAEMSPAAALLRTLRDQAVMAFKQAV
jgi:hypothetical protein